MAGSDLILKGISISKGKAFSKICLFNEGRHENLPLFKIEPNDFEREKNRFLNAKAVVRKKFDELIENVKNNIGKAEAEIFVAQKMILEDPSLQEKVFSRIEKDFYNAEKAIVVTLDEYELKLLNIDNEYLKERATDIGEIKRRLLDVLVDLTPNLVCSGESFCQKGKSRIIIAKELTPSLTIELDTDSVLAFVTEHGGAASHAAILARSLGIPAVSGIKDIHKIVYCGAEIFVDGDKGEVVINPSKELLIEAGDFTNRVQEDSAIESEPIIEGFKIMGNLNLSKNINDIDKYNAEGIGLYRSEFEFFSAGKLLDEDEQFERYSKVVKALDGNPLYFRMLDIGGDKTAPFFNLPKEENPYLGFRGTRLLIGRDDLFKNQARAIARASEFGEVHIVYPMIIDKNQFIKIKDLFMEFTKDIDSANLKHGIMFEVPSACIQADEIFDVIDFASIGSNDLVQYLFAVDRNNELVAYDYHPERDVFWSIIKNLVTASIKYSKPLSICGEIAGDINYVQKLIEAGIDTISINPSNISNIRKYLKENK